MSPARYGDHLCADIYAVYQQEVLRKVLGQYEEERAVAEASSQLKDTALRNDSIDASSSAYVVRPAEA